MSKPVLRTIIASGDPVIFQKPGLDNLEPEHAKQWTDRTNNRLKEHVITVPKAWQKAAMPNRRFPRDCFARAIQFIHASPHLPGALYVFGETIGGGHNQHGWVEIEDCVVFDGVMQQFYDRSGYYAVEQARPWYRYTRPAMMYLRRQIRKDPSMSYCWHAYLGLPWAKDPLNPLLVDLERAKAGFQMREQRKYRTIHIAEAEA